MNKGNKPGGHPVGGKKRKLSFFIILGGIFLLLQTSIILINITMFSQTDPNVEQVVIPDKIIRQGEDHIPLNYDLWEISYPEERIPLKDLNFCDIGWSGIARAPEIIGTKGGALECPRQGQNGTFDPSCISCLKPSSLEKGEVVLKHYYDPEEQKARREKMAAWFDQHESTGDAHSDQVVVVVFADTRYLSLLAHWWCHAQKRGVGRHRLVVFAATNDVEEWAASEGLFAISPATYGIDFLKLKMGSVNKWCLLPLYLDLMEMGWQVIYNDVDLIWALDLTKRLPMLYPSEINLVSALARWNDARGKLNSAILSLRPTKELIVFVETLLSTVPLFVQKLHMAGDQMMWNHLLRHHAFRGLTWKAMPERLLLRGNNITLFKWNETLAMHFPGGTHMKFEWMTERIGQSEGKGKDIMDDEECLKVLHEAETEEAREITKQRKAKAKRDPV